MTLSALDDVPALCDVADAAARLAVSEDTIRRLADRGELVSYDVGAAVRIDVESLRIYLCRHRRHVATSVGPTATSGTDGGGPTSPAAGRRASRSAPATPPRPSAGSAPASPETIAELRARLRRERRP